MNTSLAAAFTALGNGPNNTDTVITTPFKDIGPWFKVATYFDADTNDSMNANTNVERRFSAGSYNQIGGIRASEAATYTVVTVGNEKKLRDVARSANLDYTSGNKTSLDNRTWNDGLSNYRYAEKADSYSVENYDRNFGWGFDMQAVIDSDRNKTALTCEVESGNARGYSANYKAQTGNAPQHATGVHYCDNKLYSGAVGTTYRITVKQMPDYRLYNETDSAFVNVFCSRNIGLNCRCK